MKLGIDSFSYHLHFGKHWFKPSVEYNLYWFCEKCKDLKVDGIHLDPMHIDLNKDIEWLSEYTNKHDLFIEIGAIGITTEDLKPSIVAANILNSKVLRIFVGGSCEEGREQTRRKAIKAKDEIIRSLDLAEKYNVILAIENHGDLFLDDLQYILSIDSPFLGVCYDSGNFATIGVDPKAALQILIDKVVCTHIKDIYPADTYQDAEPFGLNEHKYHFGPLGGGLLPLKEIVEIIRKAKGENFQLSIEIHTPFIKSLSEHDLLKLEDDNVVNSVRYAREELGV